MLTCNFGDKKIISLDLYDNEKEYTHIRKASQGGLLFCEECGAPVVFNGGSIKVYHFKHKIKEGCQYSKYHDSKMLLDIKKKFYIHLKKYYPNNTILVDYKHPDNKRSHFYIPEIQTVFQIQNGNSNIQDWENKITKIKSKGLKYKWFFLSNRTNSMRQASFANNDKEIFRTIDKTFSNIIFESKFEPIYSQYGINPTQEYSLIKHNIIEAENLFIDFLEREKLKKARAYKTLLERKINTSQINSNTKLRNDSNVSLTLLNPHSSIDIPKEQNIIKVSEKFESYIEKGNLFFIKMLERHPLKLKNFVIRNVLLKKTEAIGYFNPSHLGELTVIDPDNPYQIIEIRNIKKGELTGKIHIFNFKLNAPFELDASFEKLEGGILKIKFYYSEIFLKFHKLEKNYYLIYNVLPKDIN